MFFFSGGKFLDLSFFFFFDCRELKWFVFLFDFDWNVNILSGMTTFRVSVNFEISFSQFLTTAKNCNWNGAMVESRWILNWNSCNTTLENLYSLKKRVDLYPKKMVSWENDWKKFVKPKNRNIESFLKILRCKSFELKKHPACRQKIIKIYGKLEKFVGPRFFYAEIGKNFFSLVNRFLIK